jgi:hypothetical protein
MPEASFSFDELQSANTVESPDPETLKASNIASTHIIPAINAQPDSHVVVIYEQ